MLFAEVFAVPHYVLRRDGWLCDGLQCRRRLGEAVDKKIHPQKSCFVSCNYEQFFLQNDGEASIVPKTARIWTAGFIRALTNAPTSAIVLAVSGRLPATGLKGVPQDVAPCRTVKISPSQGKHFRMIENHTRSPIKMLKYADKLSKKMPPQAAHRGGFGDKVSELRNFSESAVYLFGPKRQFTSNWGIFDLCDPVPFPLARI